MQIPVHEAREGDPDFTAIWESIEAGKLTSFSIEGIGELIEEESA